MSLKVGDLVEYEINAGGDPRWNVNYDTWRVTGNKDGRGTGRVSRVYVGRNETGLIEVLCVNPVTGSMYSNTHQEKKLHLLSAGCVPLILKKF